MKRQEVVSGLSEASDGSHALDALMEAMPVVVMDPAIEHVGTLRGTVVGDTVSPLAQISTGRPAPGTHTQQRRLAPLGIRENQSPDRATTRGSREDQSRYDPPLASD